MGREMSMPKITLQPQQKQISKSSLALRMGKILRRRRILFYPVLKMSGCMLYSFANTNGTIP